MAFLFRMTGFEISGIFGCAAGLRCPIKSSGLRCSLILSTAAHKTLCFICHRQRRAFWPKARDLLCSQAAAGSKRSMKTQREPPIKGSSLCVVRMTGFEISGIFGCAAGLRCPIKSSGLRCSLILSTAAHKTLCFICHRQRRAFWPKARDLLCSQAAAGSKRSMKTQREPPIKGSSLCVVRMTGFEPAASCSQSKRSTKLSHIRLSLLLYTTSCKKSI